MMNSHSTHGPVMLLRPLALNGNLFLEIALFFFNVGLWKHWERV